MRWLVEVAKSIYLVSTMWHGVRHRINGSFRRNGCSPPMHSIPLLLCAHGQRLPRLPFEMLAGNPEVPHPRRQRAMHRPESLQWLQLIAGTGGHPVHRPPNSASARSVTDALAPKWPRRPALHSRDRRTELPGRKRSTSLPAMPATPDGAVISATTPGPACSSSAPKRVRSRLSPVMNSPEDCPCLAKARASRPWRKAQT